MPEDYFALQLSFAARHAEVAGMPFDAAVAHCTNLRRRFHLQGAEGAGRWDRFLVALRACADDHPAALALCMDLFQHRPEPAEDQARAFGCFSFDPPDGSGTLRIHFMPPPGTCASPLASAQTAARMDELRALFLQVRRLGSAVTSVLGVSWLYNLEAYRRLFPPAYGASVRPPWFALHLNGSSTWGQVLDWRQAVKPQVRDAVLANLPAMTADAPWTIFPHQPLVARCAIGHFHDAFA